MHKTIDESCKELVATAIATDMARRAEVPALSLEGWRMDYPQQFTFNDADGQYKDTCLITMRHELILATWKRGTGETFSVCYSWDKLILTVD